MTSDKSELSSAMLLATRASNAKFAHDLPLTDQQAFEDARRGWIAALPPGGVDRAGGGKAWDNSWFDFLDSPCPDTVNPSLWRHAQLNSINGLFKICDGVWQARGCDYANMTIIRGSKGWIIVDPLIARETSAAVLQLVNETLGRQAVSAVIVTHCHPDHFAGIRGVVGDDPASYPPIFAPEDFMEFAASEGVMGGNQMARRAIYQFGIGLPIGPEGMVDGGIGKTVARGSRGFVPPSNFISRTGEQHIIDGVTFEFQMASGTEAPAEFTFLLPDHQVLCMAEVCTQNMHNLLPPRGAEVRDGLLWSRTIDEALRIFGDRADVLINSHNWPVWGRQALREYLAEQRDIYKYVHDQTLRLANHGHNADEIAAMITEPDWLKKRFHARGYYGTLTFNARATYQKYYGFYDGRPVNLDPLPSEEAATRYVEAMGGVDKVIELALNAIKQDELQWASTLLNHAVFSDAVISNEQSHSANRLLADVYRQQGYRAESGIVRNCYLKAAQELEDGVVPIHSAGGRNSDLVATLSLEDWFSAYAVRLNPERARGVTLLLRFDVDGVSVLVNVGRQTEFTLIDDNAATVPVDAIVSLTQHQLEALANGTLEVDAAQSFGVEIEGEIATLRSWLDLHDHFELWFNVVTP